ncbi:PREDICTED: uncharacterized protein LOC104609736 [Nelumbo nucifera]|uniref:Plant bHLH transcription factor ACT-like domain-containing protein n=2 Tax=Nelumbo nucifera TaxID=4432 RepID=A0A822XQA3_NELNU|nr:PREDICTED: uncharacterized protein LOC104609736 [Nelumbo nucifera]DAD21279.1 TPA_asm: hypothetical protein HUJ06_022742 [Nelumbo nucifera]
MASRQQKRVAFRRKLQILRSLTSSKSVRKSSIIRDAFNYINQLKLKLEALNQAYGDHLKQIQLPTEVKVERIENGFVVEVRCEKGPDLLVSILEAFEDTSLNVLQARVSSNHCFCMESMVEAQDQALDARDVTQAVLRAISKQRGEGNGIQGFM